MISAFESIQFTGVKLVGAHKWDASLHFRVFRRGRLLRTKFAATPPAKIYYKIFRHLFVRDWPGRTAANVNQYGTLTTYMHCARRRADSDQAAVFAGLLIPESR
jgi:hypothetical protein